MRARIFVSAALLSAVAYACGGVDSDLVNGDGDDDGGSSRDASVRDSGGRDGSTSGRDSGGGSDGGGGGGDSGVKDGGVIPPKTGIIQCGNNGSTSGVGGTAVNCNAADPTCCATQYPFDMVNPLNYSCTANKASCSDFDSGSVPIDCRSNADCPGTAQCCGHETTYNTFPADPITIYDTVHCQATCPLSLPDGGDNANRLFCDPAAAVSVCPPTESCVASTLLPGFNVCGTL